MKERMLKATAESLMCKDPSFRLARICEVRDGSGERIQFDYDGAAKIAQKMWAARGELLGALSTSEQHNISAVESTGSAKFELHEAPVVIFPKLRVNDGQMQFDCRISITVCMGSSRSKVWARATQIESTEIPYDRALKVLGSCESLASDLANLAVNFYADQISSYRASLSLRHVYDVPVSTVEIKDTDDKKLAELLGHNRGVSLADSFNICPMLFDAAKSLIFAPSNIRVNTMRDYLSLPKSDTEWLRITNPHQYSFGLFLQQEFGDAATAFHGFVVDGDKSDQNLAPEYIENEPASVLASRNVLDMISPLI